MKQCDVPAMEIKSHREYPMEPAQVQRLHIVERWWPERTLTDIGTILDYAASALGAWRGDRLIGFVRAVSDGVTRAYVEDMVIDPGHRGEVSARR